MEKNIDMIIAIIIFLFWFIPIPLCSWIDRIGIKKGMWGDWDVHREFKLIFWWIPLINWIVFLSEVVIIIYEITESSFPKFFDRFYNKDIERGRRN